MLDVSLAVSMSSLQPPCSKVSLAVNTFQLAAVKHELLTGKPYNTAAEVRHLAQEHTPQLVNIPNHLLRRCIRCEALCLLSKEHCFSVPIQEVSQAVTVCPARVW